MEIINHRSKVCATTTRAGARIAAGASSARETPDFFPSGTAASVLIAPARHFALIIYYYSGAGVSPIERSPPDEETSLKLDINSGLRGRYSISGRPRVSVGVIFQKVFGNASRILMNANVCGLYLSIDRFSPLSDSVI